MGHRRCRASVLLPVLLFLLLPSTLCSQDAMIEGASIMQLLAALQSPDADTRSQAATALGRLGEAAADAAPQLAAALSDDAEKVRANAAWALARIGSAAASAVPALTRALSDSSLQVRGRAAVALGALGPRAASAGMALGDAIHYPEHAVKAAAAGALWSVSGDATRSSPVLSALLEHEDAEARTQAAEAIARVGGNASVLAPNLARVLAADGRAGVRAAAAQALGAVGETSAVARSALKGALETETDAGVREALNDAITSLESDSPAGRLAEGGVRDGRVLSSGQAPTRSGSVQPAADGGQDQSSPTARVDTQTGSGAAQPARRDAELGAGPDPLPARQHGPGPVDGGDATPPEPVHDGKTLTEWIAQLDSDDVANRRLAAVALGEMGDSARGAIGRLNRARLYGEHDTVRHQAALALARILGVSLGDTLQQPPGGGTGTGGGDTSGPVPQGKVFYLSGVHSVTEQGVEPLDGLTRESDTYQQWLWGFTNENLNYLDIAEASRYRQDAAKRGLNAQLRLFDLLQSEPETEQERISTTYKLFHSYHGDYVARITCNQQTYYQYYRYYDGDYDWHGGCEHWGMTPGRYDAEITIWTEDGFRLDFKVPFTAIVDVNPEEGDQDLASKVNGPEDIAKEERQYEASLQPGTTDYERKAYPFKKASAAAEIGERVMEVMLGVPRYQPIMPDDYLPYIEEVLSQHQRAAQLAPDRRSLSTEVLKNLVSACSGAPTAASYARAAELTALIEARLADPKLQAEEMPYGAGHVHRTLAYIALAKMALTYQMDINGYFRFWSQALAHRGLCRGPMADEVRKFDLAAKQKVGPQVGWWNPGADELQQPTLAELISVGDGQGESTEGADKQGDGEGQISAAGQQELDKAVADADEGRADDLEYVMGIRHKLTNADADTGVAMARLDVIRRNLRETEHRIMKLGSYLKPSSGRPEDLTGLEEALYYAFKDSEELREDLAGAAAGGAERMRANLQRMLDDQIEWKAALEQERDRIVEDTLLNYESIAQSLQNRGPQLYEAKTRDVAASALETTRSLIALRKAQLYAVSGQSSEFREAARKCIETSQEFDYQVRLMESAHFQEQGQLSPALRAARMALEVKGEDTVGARIEMEDGTVTWELTPAQARLKQLEVKALKAIAAKTAQDAAFVRRMCEEQIAVHGDEGITGVAYDLVFMGRYISAKGENSLITRLYDWVTGNELTLPTSPISGTPIDREDTEAGKPESQSREMGVVMDDASRTVLGLLLIRRLREANVPLSKIRGTDGRQGMSAQEFRETVAEALGKEEGDRWHNLTDAQVMKLRSELHFAMQQADVEKLMAGKSQVLDVEAGRGYYDTESFTTNWRDIVEDQACAFNVALFALPNAKVAKEGRKLSFLEWAHPAAGVEAVPLKYAVAEKVGISSAVQWAVRHPLGERLAYDLVDTHAKMSLFGKVTVDAALQYNAMSIAKYGTEYAVGKLGYDQVTQEKAGRVMETLTQIGTAFGMDLDVTVAFAREAINARQAQAVGKALSEALRSSDELAATAQQHDQLLRRLVPELESAGKLSPESHRLAKSAAQELEAKLDSLRKSLPAEAEAHALVNDNYRRLQMLYEGLQMAADGMPTEAKRFSIFAEELAQKLAEGRSSLIQQVQASSRAAAGGPVATGQDMSVAPKFNDELDFRKPSAMPVADALLEHRQFRQAAKLYEAGYLVYEQLGQAGDDAAQMLVKRWRLAKHLEQAKNFFGRMGANADPNVGVMKPITEAEVTGWKNAPDLEFDPIVGETGRRLGASEPLWVKVGGQRVCVFKPPHPDFPGAIQAETVVPRIGEALQRDIARIADDVIASGARAPAATKAVMPIPAEVDGTFAVFKAADDAGAATADWRKLLGAPDVELLRVVPDGPATYWVMQNGKRVGLFVPDSVTPDAQAAGNQLAKIAGDAGGETLGAVPKVRMTVPEVEGTLVRYFDGTDLINFTDVERIVLKKQIAQNWVLRLLVGDYDAHALNLKVGPDGRLGGIDWNLADLLEEGKGLDLASILGKAKAGGTPVELAADVEKLMRHRLKYLQGQVRGNRPQYQCMGRVAEQMILEDFAEALETIQAWDRASLRQLIGDSFGADTDRVLNVLEARIRCMEGVLQSTFPSVPAPTTGGAALGPREGSSSIAALHPSCAYVVSLWTGDARGPAWRLREREINAFA